MVAYTGYESDNRVRRYAETLVRRGWSVDVIALRVEEESSKPTINGVNVFRIQRRVRNEKSKIGYLGKLILFFARSMGLLAREHLRCPYDLVHIHSVPDFEVFAAVVPKLMGAKLILDIHDIVPEFYCSKFGVSPSSVVFRLLVGVERLSAAFSDHVIAANHIWEDRLSSRSVPADKCTTILNFPDTNIFRARERRRSDDKFIILYPGTLNYHQGIDIAIRAFAKITQQVPRAEFHIYGRGDQFDQLRLLISELQLEDRVFLRGICPADEIAAIMADADLGVVPKRNSGFGNEAFSTKILEFMCVGVPMIIPDTLIDRYYFNDGVAKFFTANDETSLAEAMLLLIRDPRLRTSLAENATMFVKNYTWEANESIYLNLVDTLMRSPCRVKSRNWVNPL